MRFEECKHKDYIELGEFLMTPIGKVTYFDTMIKQCKTCKMVFY